MFGGLLGIVDVLEAIPVTSEWETEPDSYICFGGWCLGVIHFTIMVEETTKEWQMYFYKMNVDRLYLH